MASGIKPVKEVRTHSEVFYFSLTFLRVMNAGLVAGLVLIVVFTLAEGQAPSACNGDPDLVCSMTSPCPYAGEECIDGCCTDVTTTTTPSSTCSDPEFICYDPSGTFQCYEGETCDATGCCVDVTTPAP